MLNDELLIFHTLKLSSGTKYSGSRFNAKKSGRVFRKESIYVGEFRKGDMEFSIDEPLLHHWSNGIDLQLSNGVRIDVSSEHSAKPEDSRGKVVGSEIGLNENNDPALFLYVEFANDAYASLADTAEVSIFSPPSYQDGKGNTYYRPIRGLALTQNPVIPGLSSFELVLSHTGTAPMPLRALAKSLGISVADEATDAQISASISKAFSTLKKAKAKTKPDPVKPDQTIVASNNTAFNRGLLRRSRQADIESLVSDGHITPAVAVELSKQWTSDDALTLSLSHEPTMVSFDTTINALKKGKAASLGNGEDESGAQLLELSATDIHDPKKNIMLATAQRAAEAAKTTAS